MFRFILPFFCLITLMIHADEALDQRKKNMYTDLDIIKHILEVKYAPLTLKKTSLNWDLDEAFNKAKQEIGETEQITTKKFQQIVRRLLASMRDFHVAARFSSTERAFLPFSVRKVGGRYFIDTIDEETLSEMNFDIEVGDELLEFDRQPVDDVVNQLISEMGLDPISPTAQMLATNALTDRSGKKGDDVPDGSVYLTIRSVSSGSRIKYQLMWDYFTEMVYSPLDLCLIGVSKPQKKKYVTNSFMDMTAPHHVLHGHPFRERAGDLGAKKSFLPELGKKVWEAQEKSPFEGYIYENEQGRKIGYVRIPDYSGSVDDIQEFARIIKHLEENTEALVLDQLHNPGGIVMYCYSLASTLTDSPLITPRHRLLLTQKDVFKAYEDFSKLEDVRSNTDATNLFPDDQYMTYEYALFYREFYRFLLIEWNSGRRLTLPTYIGGIDHINPHSKCRYTKPILMLIDEMDFSCADFLPAIMQDNKRATLFGTCTAGAGGCVSRTEFINNNGIAQIAYTFTIAERMGSELIENKGVTPDIIYEITVEDMLTKFKPYIAAVNNAVSGLLQPVPVPMPMPVPESPPEIFESKETLETGTETEIWEGE